MPVEIKEVVIKAILNDAGEQTQQTSNADLQQETIVQECVSQVLKILRKQTRR